MLGRALVALLLVVFAGCTETPHDAIGDVAFDGVTTKDQTDRRRIVARFWEISGDFERAVHAFNTSPIDRADALELADDRLREMRATYDEWSVLVDDVIDVDPEGLPHDELLAWRDAAGEWIEAQEAITRAMLRCDYELRCLESAQANHTDRAYAKTIEAQEAKRAFVAAVPD